MPLPHIRPTALLIFCVGLCLAAPARAEPDSAQIQTALASATINIEGVKLDHNDLMLFYTARGFRPAWNFADAESNAFNAFIDSIDQVTAWHGLVPDSAALDAMHRLAAATDDDSRVKLDLLVTGTLLRLAHNLHGDGINLGQLYQGWKFKRGDMDIPAALAQAVASNGVNEFLDSLSPKNPAYAALAHALRIYRDIQAKGEWPIVDSGPRLVQGDRGPRVAELRARLAIENYISPSSGKHADLFGKDLEKALTEYQLRNGLDPDGHVGPKTLVSLDLPVALRIDQIRANMERWRHMPEDFPPPRAAIVNIAAASIDILEDGKPVYRGPVIVGKDDLKTPFIQSSIRSMIINPAWHVPEKIAREDILPKLRKDPHYLEKLGFTIRDSEDDPHGENIDWKNISDEEFDFKLRQDPGDKNSLGRIKFDFDNEFAVYLHGTPNNNLFQKDRRDLSHGCVRLRDPAKIGEIILKGTSGDWSIDHIDQEVAAEKTRWIGVAKPMPVDILYWTVFPNENGQIEFRDDVYGYDALLIDSLNRAGETAETTKQF